MQDRKSNPIYRCADTPRSPAVGAGARFTSGNGPKAVLTLRPIADRSIQNYQPAFPPNLQPDFLSGRLKTDHVNEVILVADGGAVALQDHIVGFEAGRRRGRVRVDRLYQSALNTIQTER